MSEKKEITMEDVLEGAGGFGIFQKMFSLLTFYPQLTAAMIILSPVFSGTDRVTIYCQNETSLIDQCDNFNCSISPPLPEEEIVITSIVQEWNLVCSQSWIVETINTCQMIGMMMGAMISSLISDNFGRTKGFFFVTLGMGIFGMLPAAAFTPVSYAITRFLAGLGMGGTFVCLTCHLMEILTPNWRIIIGCVNLWPIGEMLLGLVAYHVPNWRYLTIVSAAPTFLVFLLFPFIQESPRWLLTRRRTQEAYEILCKMAKWNSNPPPLYSTIESLQVTVLREEADVLKGIEGVKQVLKNRELRFRLAILTWSNITCGIVYYGVSFSAKSLSGSPYMNMFYMGVLDFFAIPSILLFSNRFGRRVTFLIYMSFASISLFTILILHFSIGLAQSPPLAITLLALFGRFGIVAAWCALVTLILESFPTPLRASCMGFTAFAAYLGSVAAPSLPLLGKYDESLPYIVFSFFAITSAISSWFLKDMVGEPLKDTVNTKS